MLDAATALVNRAVAGLFGATIMPGLELADGVPPALRTLVAVPVLLGREDDVLGQIERLEVHHLASPGGDLAFALLSDWLDAETERTASDDGLLATARDAVARLNRLYPAPDGGSRFFLLHRRRLFNPSEGRWMGWERKRGKLHELNRLLRGATDTSFVGLGAGAPAVPAGVRFVVTLDGDTRLPRDTVRRLIGKMVHPPNRPRFDPRQRRVVGGAAIMQPRVTPSLPVGREGSFYQRVYSSPGGLDPCAAAVSDVDQDLFDEGSFTGKGIYDVDVFEAAMAGCVPDNTLLSHDLFESTFARAALVWDVEVVEDFPSRYDVAAKRWHPWARGDWQLAPWILGRGGPDGLPAVGRWKMVDNLRRTLVAPSAFAALALGWCLLPLPAAAFWKLLVLAALAVPAFLPILFALVPRRAGITRDSHLRALGGDLLVAASQAGLDIALIAAEAWLMGDAIVRTLHRLLVTRRHLLEWTTAAQSAVSPRRTWRFFETFVKPADNQLPPPRQLPGRPEARARSPDLPDQYRPLPPVRRRRPRLRLGGPRSDHRAPGGDLRDARHPEAVPRPLLQLVRDARPARAGAGLCVVGRQREPCRPPPRPRRRRPAACWNRPTGSSWRASRLTPSPSERPGASRNRPTTPATWNSPNSILTSACPASA